VHQSLLRISVIAKLAFPESFPAHEKGGLIVLQKNNTCIYRLTDSANGHTFLAGY
jgi:hypothetical protein